MFVCLIMLLCRWMMFLLVKRLLGENVIALMWTQKIINWGLGLLFSISAAASAIIFVQWTNGRCDSVAGYWNSFYGVFSTLLLQIMF